MKEKAGSVSYPIGKRRRTRSRAGRVIFILVVILLTAAVICISRVEALRVKVVEVSGVERVGAEKIYNISDVSIGDSLITLPVKSIRENIIDKQPLVRDVIVKRIFPSRVKIQIFERNPFAYVTNGKQYYLVDREGIVIDKPRGIQNQQLFRVESDSIGHAEVGERLTFPHAKVFRNMCRILDKYLGGVYTQVRFDQGGIKLFLKGDKYVLLGDGREIDKKIMLVPVIMKKLKEAGEEYEGLNLEYLEVPSFVKKLEPEAKEKG